MRRPASSPPHIGLRLARITCLDLLLHPQPAQKSRRRVRTLNIPLPSLLSDFLRSHAATRLLQYPKHNALRTAQRHLLGSPSSSSECPKASLILGTEAQSRPRKGRPILVMCGSACFHGASQTMTGPGLISIPIRIYIEHIPPHATKHGPRTQTQRTTANNPASAANRSDAATPSKHDLDTQAGRSQSRCAHNH